jgi:hypothetical protein
LKLQIVLTDDWELRGNGSGNMRAIQFDTLRRLTAIYEAHGLRGSFNAEVLQQLSHLRLADRHPELGNLAREWETTLTAAFRRGHDVQLHLHPQWTRAEYVDGQWRLGGAWSLLEYPKEQIRELVRECKTYLEELLRPIDPNYRCISFRSGSWCIAPSDTVLDALAEEGLVLDMSIVDGAYYDTKNVHVDYRDIDEPFLPYHPDMRDARRVSEHPQSIVCVPTHSFMDDGLRQFGRPTDPIRPGASLRHRLGIQVARVLLRLGAGRVRAELLAAPNSLPIPDAGYSHDYASQEWSSHAAEDEPKGAPTPFIWTSDLSKLHFLQMLEMMRNAKRRAATSGWPVVPVILENHTKDIGNWRPIERFAAHLAGDDDVDVITLRELAQNLIAGAYPVRPIGG